MRRVADRLLDIRDAVQDVLDFTEGMDEAAFLLLAERDRKGYRAIKNALSELGEAIKALPPNLTARHPAMDWRGLAGLRDIIIHQYFGVDLRRLWPVVREEFPALIQAVQDELRRSD